MAEEIAPKQKRFTILSRFRAFLRRTFGIKSYFELGRLRPPLLICFDHLYSEYLTVRHKVADLPNADCAAFVESLPEKRAEGTLSWSDLYNFQLILADILPAEQLRTKIRRLRFDYRSVAGEKEFDDYMASKPPDLQSPPQPGEDQSESHYEKLLRDDLKDLLGRMYLEYAILPVREERLTDLTWVAARLCLFSLISLLGILAILFVIPLIEEIARTDGDFFDRFNALGNSEKLSALTVFVVVVSGAMGGFVSALRRIQTPATEGDSLYNLSLLFHGSYSIFVAPISGAIFAIIIYLLFTSATLTGTFFPAIYTPTGKFTDGALDPETQTSPSSTPTPAPTPAPVPLVGQSPGASPSPKPRSPPIDLAFTKLSITAIFPAFRIRPMSAAERANSTLSALSATNARIAASFSSASLRAAASPSGAHSYRKCDRPDPAAFQFIDVRPGLPPGQVVIIRCTRQQHVNMGVDRNDSFMYFAGLCHQLRLRFELLPRRGTR